MISLICEIEQKATNEQNKQTHRYRKQNGDYQRGMGWVKTKEVNRVTYTVMIADQTLGGEHVTGQHGVQSRVTCIHVTHRFVWKETGLGREPQD